MRIKIIKSEEAAAVCSSGTFKLVGQSGGLGAPQSFCWVLFGPWPSKEKCEPIPFTNYVCTVEEKKAAERDGFQLLNKYPDERGDIVRTVLEDFRKRGIVAMFP